MENPELVKLIPICSLHTLLDVNDHVVHNLVFYWSTAKDPRKCLSCSCSCCCCSCSWIFHLICALSTPTTLLPLLFIHFIYLIYVEIETWKILVSMVVSVIMIVLPLVERKCVEQRPGTSVKVDDRKMAGTNTMKPIFTIIHIYTHK